MSQFEELQLPKSLFNALNELGVDTPTPIQLKSFPVMLSGKDMVGIAQTGTGKTFAYLLPILKELKYAEQTNPRVLIVVPTRELVLQVVEQATLLTKYMNVRVMGIYGGTNINTQRTAVADGMDILVATPGRLYDLVLDRSIQLKNVKKLVIDEVDVMLDLGFRFQINNILELLPERKQSAMFSATITEEVEQLITDFFIAPTKVSVAMSGEPLANIVQESYPVVNFYTKINLLLHLLADRDMYHKVLVFAGNKKAADRIFETMEENDPSLSKELCIVHSNKSQNYRVRSLKQFNEGEKRILIATDVIARGLDMDKISHVINLDTPAFPENYIHRIGRTGRAESEGRSILFFTEKEAPFKAAIESLMKCDIPENDFPKDVEISTELAPEERPKTANRELNRGAKDATGRGEHEKKNKNKKVNLGGSYRREIAKKYKKPKTRGDKNFGKKKKRRR